MTPPKQTQAQRRAELIEAATQVFADYGYAAATMAEIARAAGVAKGTPYLYFGDKTELFYAVFKTFTAQVMQATNAALEGVEGAPAQLRALALGAVAYMDCRRDCFPLSMEIWAASNTPALRERFAAILHDLYAGYRAQAVAIIQQGQAAGDIRSEVDADALATMVVGAMDGLFLQCWFDPSLDATRVVENFFATLEQGALAA